MYAVESNEDQACILLMQDCYSLFVCLFICCSEYDRHVAVDADTRRLRLSVSSGLGVTDSAGGIRLSTFVWFQLCYHFFCLLE